jgi:hypothetical protein
MDVYSAIYELYEEKKRIDAAISALENRLRISSNGNGVPRSRRGRRFMGVEERQEVSRRMSRYWASRRAQIISSVEPSVLVRSTMLQAQEVA